MNEEGIRCKYHGINIYIVPDAELDTIILPESLAKYISELQNNTIKNANQTHRGKRSNLIGFINDNQIIWFNILTNEIDEIEQLNG